MSQYATIVFVCEHGAAKSILAAAYFNEMADRMGLDITAIARGTDPDPELSEQATQGLSKDGLEPAESVPQKLSLEDVRSTRWIVSFCKLPKEYQAQAIVERWDDVPAVSENYDRARDAIVERLDRLFGNIRSSQ